MILKIDLSSLSNEDLFALEQEILTEQSCRVMNGSSAIAAKPDAPEKSHQDAINKLLRRSQNL